MKTERQNNGWFFSNVNHNLMFCISLSLSLPLGLRKGFVKIIIIATMKINWHPSLVVKFFLKNKQSYHIRHQDVRYVTSQTQSSYTVPDPRLSSSSSKPVMHPQMQWASKVARNADKSILPLISAYLLLNLKVVFKINPPVLVYLTSLVKVTNQWQLN